MKVLIIGGLGYTGSVLTQMLLSLNHEVTVLDSGLFGNWIKPESGLRVVLKDLRDIESLEDSSFDSVVHLANIANDPAVELSPSLSWEVNALGTKIVAEWAVSRGIQHFIYASSGSVYGVSELENVTEDVPMRPISVYNKTKMVAERILESYRDYFHFQIIRPATVCGVSPRMRFDVAVNLLTLQAHQTGTMTVHGGSQVRPNIHIQDLARVYIHFLNNPGLASGAYNAGFENLSILELAKRVQEISGGRIEVSSQNDPRSYRQDSSKLISTGFSPERNVSGAIQEIWSALESGNVIDRDEWHTVKWMQKLGLN